jgi:hypothetical protein
MITKIIRDFWVFSEISLWMENQGGHDVELHAARFYRFDKDELCAFPHTGMNKLKTFWLQALSSQGQQKVSRSRGWEDEIKSSLMR